MDAKEILWNFLDNISGYANHIYKFPGGFDSYFRKSQNSRLLQNFEKCKTF